MTFNPWEWGPFLFIGLGWLLFFLTGDLTEPSGKHKEGEQ